VQYPEQITSAKNPIENRLKTAISDQYIYNDLSIGVIQQRAGGN